MALKSWKQVVHDCADAYRMVTNTTAKVKVSELAGKISSIDTLNIKNAKTEKYTALDSDIEPGHFVEFSVKLKDGVATRDITFAPRWTGDSVASGYYFYSNEVSDIVPISDNKFLMAIYNLHRNDNGMFKGFVHFGILDATSSNFVLTEGTTSFETNDSRGQFIQYNNSYYYCSSYVSKIASAPASGCSLGFKTTKITVPVSGMPSFGTPIIRTIVSSIGAVGGPTIDSITLIDNGRIFISYFYDKYTNPPEYDPYVRNDGYAIFDLTSTSTSFYLHKTGTGDNTASALYSLNDGNIAIRGVYSNSMSGIYAYTTSGITLVKSMSDFPIYNEFLDKYYRTKIENGQAKLIFYTYDSSAKSFAETKQLILPCDVSMYFNAVSFTKDNELAICMSKYSYDLKKDLYTLYILTFDYDTESTSVLDERVLIPGERYNILWGTAHVAKKTNSGYGFKPELMINDLSGERVACVKPSLNKISGISKVRITSTEPGEIYTI